MEKFIVTPKEDKSVTMTIRIDRALQEEYNDLAAKTNRSRNELISMALQYALDHINSSLEKVIPRKGYCNPSLSDTRHALISNTGFLSFHFTIDTSFENPRKPTMIVSICSFTSYSVTLPALHANSCLFVLLSIFLVPFLLILGNKKEKPVKPRLKVTLLL